MAFRKIDIDAMEEDAFGQDEIDSQEIGDVHSQEVEAQVNSRAQEVRALLQRGDNNGALSRSLLNPPYGRGLEVVKLKSTQIVMEVLNSTKTADVAQLVKNLPSEEQDVLMKYLYAGMAAPEQNSSGVLLAWHEKLTEVAGQGCIVRVITDRRTV
ncbi:hypothetical protein BGZ65_008379 [Modicella reniformis]|uniref:Actin-related protein 2/3 complex subunit 5 n=1 Tax=Modicella reniformis TaxID=1440133 RepID=A0A9P6LU38_9FUNG|nr:hypothetical protein BGZ65_008379 [Modicella reniformis]